MRLGWWQISILLGYCIFMTGGQIAFKYISLSLGQSASLADAASRLPFNIWFWLTGLLYFFSMIYWTWVLVQVPLAIAYPFVSLTLVIVPLLGWALFSEALTIINIVGIGLIVIGVAFVAH